MADNVAITAGAGTTIATDDIGAGVQVQRVKPTWGPDGTANDIDVATGKPLPIQPRTSAGVEIPFPAALAANGGLKIEGVAGGVAVPISLDTMFADDAAFTIATSKVNVIGAVAVAHGANPDAADALDAVAMITNRHRVPFFVGGHPNIVSYGMSLTTASNLTIGPTIASGTKLVVTSLSVLVDNASTVFPSVVIGFGTANAPAFATTPGTAKILLGHPGCPAGGGISKGDGTGIIGIGADDEELRITIAGGTVGGNGLYVLMTGFTIES